MEAPGEDIKIDLNGSYIDKVEDAVRGVCIANGFSDPGIHIETLGPGETLIVSIDTGGILPFFSFNVYSYGAVDFCITSGGFARTVFGGDSNTDTHGMSEHLEYLTFCQSMAERIEKICLIKMTVDDELYEKEGHIWQAPSKKILNETGGVEDAEYVRQIVGTIVDSIKTRKS